MKRGQEVSRRRSLIVALLGQIYFVFLWLEAHTKYGSSKDPELLCLMYFIVPIILGTLMRSWKVFLAALGVPVLLVIGETLYFAIQLKAAGPS